MLFITKKIRGERVSTIPKAARKVHDCLVGEIRRYVSEFEPTKVYSWHPDSTSPLCGIGGIRYEEGVGHVILVDKRVLKNTILEEYERFLFVNSPNPDWNIMKNTSVPTRLDFFEQIVAHEYAHLIEDKLSNKITRSMRETLPFWFSEVITGFTSLFLSFEDYYARFDEMEEVYNRLHDSSCTQGIGYTLKNIDGVLNL